MTSRNWFFPIGRVFLLVLRFLQDLRALGGSSWPFFFLSLEFFKFVIFAIFAIFLTFSVFLGSR